MASFGETLKRERELREISLRQIAEATKINIRYLEALEENRFDALPGGLFNKGFIRAFAKFIGIDSEAMVNSYLQEAGPHLPGTGVTAGRDQAPMHRPAEVPPRRAVARLGDASPGRAMKPAITFAPPAPRPVAAGVVAVAADATGSGDLARAPRRSRALFWILSLVAAAGVLFLLVSVLRQAPPAASLPAENPGTESGGPFGPSEEAEPAPQGAREQPDGSSALLPEMSQPSHITLGALTSASPAGVTSGPGERGAAALPDAGPMQVEIQATDQTFVRLVCDGREVVDRVMEARETEEARCDAVVRISATDAGAVRVTVNGAPCLPLGDPGTKAYGYTIRVDDFARICPRGGRGSRGRR